MYKYFNVPYYKKFWRHVNLAILKNPYLSKTITERFYINLSEKDNRGSCANRQKCLHEACMEMYITLGAKMSQGKTICSTVRVSGGTKELMHPQLAAFISDNKRESTYFLPT